MGRLSTSPSLPDLDRSGRRQILVAEDNEADVYLISKAMEGAEIDADLHVVSDGLKATQFFDRADADENAPCPDLVLLDINLPKKNGDEVLRHLRGSRACKNARVLIFTTSDSPAERGALLALGANGYFRKPSEYDDFMKLGGVVKTLLESSGG